MYIIYNKYVKQFLNDEEGVTTIEYILVATLIAMVIIAGATLAGTNLNAIFAYITGSLKLAP